MGCERAWQLITNLRAPSSPPARWPRPSSCRFVPTAFPSDFKARFVPTPQKIGLRRRRRACSPPTARAAPRRSAAVRGGRRSTPPAAASRRAKARRAAGLEKGKSPRAGPFLFFNPPCHARAGDARAPPWPAGLPSRASLPRCLISLRVVRSWLGEVRVCALDSPAFLHARIEGAHVEVLIFFLGDASAGQGRDPRPSRDVEALLFIRFGHHGSPQQ